MRIAVCTDEAGQTSQIWEGSAVRIYSKKNNLWCIDEELPYTVATTISLTEAKESFSVLLHKIRDCKVFVAVEVSGQFYYQLEFRHMNSYNATGEPAQYLDSILAAEITEQNLASRKKAEALSDPTKPQPTEQEGVYYINLSKAMADSPCLTSKSILLPILAERNFKEIIIECQHIPRWFEADLKAQGFLHSITAQAENKMTVTITTGMT
ncbi:MAG: Fe-only nitrogenase accessory protein AnfO [Herbinix sp.]|jgi:Fe-only nitrogenase accessory protein AnfO|nr:Fe-only nitrogenase accessory protein AnfO [Herbinix sp.]